MPASMEARIAEHAATPIPPTSPTYDQAPLGHRAAMIRIRDDIPEEDMPPWRRFILTASHYLFDISKESASSSKQSTKSLLTEHKMLVMLEAVTVFRAMEMTSNKETKWKESLQWKSSHGLLLAYDKPELLISSFEHFSFCLAEALCTDKAKKTTRKRLKPGKHEHKNGRAHKKLERSYLSQPKSNTKG
ncbi:hypothetical protein Tco_0862818 [Tanacetum coccineum]